MTEYNLKPVSLTTLSVQEAKEKRRKVVAAAVQTRRENYLRFFKKMRLQASSEMV